MAVPIPIKIENANISGQGGSITDATITGDATLEQPPAGGDAHPSHPINLPPQDAPEGSYYIFCYCPNPPPPHWEWILITPGDPPPRPHPEPPEPPSTTPPGFKPPPADGGWGYFPPADGWNGGWVYYPGPAGAGPKRR